MISCKRLFDVTVASAAFVLTLPVQAVAAGAIAVSLGRPIIFAQQRPGLHGKPFMLRKFRSMHPVDPARGWTDDESRLTSVGKLVRATSIDELPTLLNVIKGDMSLVGPRPLKMEYLERYSPEQARRHDVLPGLTGLAQVSGRNGLAWPERFALDVYYVDHQSLALDLKILWKTVLVVLKREGISAQGHATMTPFLGNDPA